MNNYNNYNTYVHVDVETDPNMHKRAEQLEFEINKLKEKIANNKLILNQTPEDKKTIIKNQIVEDEIRLNELYSTVHKKVQNAKTDKQLLMIILIFFGIFCIITVIFLLFYF